MRCKRRYERKETRDCNMAFKLTTRGTWGGADHLARIPQLGYDLLNLLIYESSDTLLHGFLSK